METPLHSSLMSGSRHAAVLFHPAVYGFVVDATLIVQKETESGLASGAELHNHHMVAPPLAACNCTLDTEDGIQQLYLIAGLYSSATLTSTSSHTHRTHTSATDRKC